MTYIDFSYSARQELKEAIKDGNRDIVSELRDIKKIQSETLEVQKKTLAALEKLNENFNKFAAMIEKENSIPNVLKDSDLKISEPKS